MASLAVYYSWGGNTEAAANGLSSLLGSKSRKIEEIKLRRGPIGIIKGSVTAFLGSSSDIKPMDTSLKGYSKIFLLTPVWAGSAFPAMNAFIDEADFQGTEVVLVFTFSSLLRGKSVEKLSRKIESKGGKIAGIIELRCGNLTKEEIFAEAKNLAGKYL
jgi:flavodoxin